MGFAALSQVACGFYSTVERWERNPGEASDFFYSSCSSPPPEPYHEGSFLHPLPCLPCSAHACEYQVASVEPSLSVGFNFPGVCGSCGLSTLVPVHTWSLEILWKYYLNFSCQLVWIQHLPQASKCLCSFSHWKKFSFCNFWISCFPYDLSSLISFKMCTFTYYVDFIFI